MVGVDGESPRQAASEFEHSRALHAAARAGHAVNGLLHILIGGIALSVAFGGGGEADQGGALGGLAQSPAGIALLWIIVVGLWGLGLFQVLKAALVRGTDRGAWTGRAKEGGLGIAYLAIGFTAFSYAIGTGSDSSSQTQSLSARLLGSPGGVVVLVILALVVIIVGVSFVLIGVRMTFMKVITRPPGAAGRATEGIGRVGYIAKGVAIGVVGILFAVAAFTADPEEATGLDGALKALAALPFGVVVLTAIALGLIAYGVFCFLRARYVRL